jgi:adenylate cyclase
VDVDMRIGVDSGSVISDLIGLRKWQFEIWSRDVTDQRDHRQSHGTIENSWVIN